MLEIQISAKNLESNKIYFGKDGQIPNTENDSNKFFIPKDNHDEMLLIFLLNVWPTFEESFFDGAPPREVINESRKKILAGFKNNLEILEK